MNQKLLTLCSSIALLIGTTQLSYAHSGFKTSTLTSADTAATSWNAINVTHGCGDAAGTTKKDVIALSILFPVAANTIDFKNNVVASKGLAAVLATPAATVSAIDPTYDPTIDFDFGTVGTAPAPVIANPTPVITAVTTGNIFPNTIPVAVGGKVVGFQSWLGKPYSGGTPILETVKDEAGNAINTTGSGIFGLSKVIFKADSCVKTLKIYAASVNWCESGKKSFESKTRLDAWIEPADTIFASGKNTGDIQDATFPPKLTINRDLIKTPLPVAGCDGKADTVILQPSNSFINKYLPIKSAKWPTGTSGQLFWPAIK